MYECDDVLPIPESRDYLGYPYIPMSQVFPGLWDEMDSRHCAVGYWDTSGMSLFVLGLWDSGIQALSSGIV